jgi:prepilin-type N-terminal cleavage/methylation domain-containing protein
MRRPHQAARELTMPRAQRGFTLVELLIVVAMLGVLMGIAAPSLLRARLAGNEASAIGSLRAIASAQYMYGTTCADGYFAPSLPALGVAPPNGTAFIGPDLAGAAVVVKSGFTFTIGSTTGVAAQSPASCNGVAAGASLGGFFATGTSTPGTGTRSFGVNQLGAIYYAEQSTPLAMTDTSAPAGSRPIPQ